MTDVAIFDPMLPQPVRDIALPAEDGPERIPPNPRPSLPDVFHAKLNAMHICGDPECRSVSNVSDRCPSCHSQNTTLAGLVESEATALAHEIALAAAKLDIDSFTIGITETSDAGQVRWHDIDDVSALGIDELIDVERAVRYLTLRGVLICHPDRPRWVRW